MPTLLVADDDADHRELFALALTRAGHRVLTAGDVPGAWAVLRAHEIGVALLDVRMPAEAVSSCAAGCGPSRRPRCCR